VFKPPCKCVPKETAEVFITVDVLNDEGHCKPKPCQPHFQFNKNKCKCQRTHQPRCRKTCDNNHYVKPGNCSCIKKPPCPASACQSSLNQRPVLIQIINRNNYKSCSCAGVNDNQGGQFDNGNVNGNFNGNGNVFGDNGNFNDGSGDNFNDGSGDNFNDGSGDNFDDDFDDDFEDEFEDDFES
jgi:hypothetical protein